MWKTWSPSIGSLERLTGVVFKYDLYRTFGVFALLCLVVTPAFGQTPVLTQHNDNARTGQNISETILTTANVNVNQFGKLFALPVDGQVYAQPLYVPGVTINGGVHNVVIVATENDSVYAFDADSSSAVLLWNTKASLVDAAHGAGVGETAATSTELVCGDLQPQVGITSTPVIDPATKTIYVEAKSNNGSSFIHRLHALDLLTGNEKSPGPVVIAATVSGTGDGSSNGELAFDNWHELNRPGLLLLNNTIYLAYGSQCDGSPFHGWLFAYDAGTFAKKSVYVTTPNGGLGGFWMSGAGVAADGSGNIFIASGNGDFDTTNVPARETGDTILKLGTTNQILTQLDYFTPHDQAGMGSGDGDLGSGGVVLLPDQPGSFPHILVEAGKNGKVYVVNRDQMTTNNSHYCSGCTSDTEIIEESEVAFLGCCSLGMFNAPTYWNDTLYFWGAKDVLKSVPITNGLPDFAHFTASTPFITFPGAGTSISSNGTTAGSAIVWAIDGSQYGSPGPGPGPAVLYAFDATNIQTVLYSSGQNATRDKAGNAVKFTVPTVANGKVYVGTSTEIDVYGLLGVNAPNISSISPTNALAGGPAFSLTVNGTGFVSTSVVKFNGAAKTITFVSATQLTAAITAADIATAGSATVTVTNPGSGGTSNTVSFAINAASAPTLSAAAPTSATVGGAAFPLTLTGTGFVAGATVNFGSSPAITPSSVTSTQVVATIPAADIATAGTVNVTVTNPAGGGTSNAQIFTINNPAPTATSLSPTSATAGGAAFTLTVNGTAFVSTSVVKFNGAAKITTFVTATQLAAAITAADIATAGTAIVTITNPAPGGGTSGNLSFTINAASAPALASVAPTTAIVGGAGFTLTMTGTGFVAGATVNFGSNPAITPSSVTSTQVVATIPAADIASAGTVNVTVTNPAGGGTSNAQTFTINNPAPTATSLSPTSAIAGGAAFTLTVNGTSFVSTSVVKFNGTAKATAFVSATQLTAAITAADITTAGTATVAVTNPAPGGGTSGNLSFSINAASAPTLTSLAPTSATAGGAAFTLTLTGTSFVAGATVNFGANPAITPSSVTSTQVVATIPAADIAAAGTVNVTVTNPAGGGTSNAQTFSINNPAPTAASLSPTSATAGGAAFTLTVNGTGFVSTSVVKFNGAAKTTTFVSATQLTAAITATDIATAGTETVTVTNPAPGGGPSGNLSFTINAASAPTLTSLTPKSVTAAGAAFTLTLTGTGFVAGATVNFGGNPAITPSLVTSTQIVVTIPAADIATGGTANVTVTNPPPGGGISSAETFTINNPVPTTSSLSPTSATAGGAGFTLAVNGTGFVFGSVVKFNGVAKATSFVGSTQVTAAITTADIATAGPVSVTVTNPAPGGGTSNAQTFTVNNSSNVTITSLSPASATAGSAAFALTVNGTGFVSGATVQFNGVNRATTFVSSTQVTAAILAADIATAGTASVTVTNPAPSGGTSNAQTFTINSPSGLTIASLSPPSTTAGGAAFTLTVTGTGFVSGAVVKFGGVAKTTAFKSAAQLTAAIAASDIASGGVQSITVTNPAPGGGTSNAATFTVNNTVPTLSSLSPPSVFAGSGAFTLTVNGTGFLNGASVDFNGAGRTTTFVSSTQLTVAILASDIAATGTANVTVTNPAPTTGPSASLALNITNENNPVPAISALDTTHVTGGAAFTLTVNGSNFEAKSVVNLNGKAEATTFVSTTRISAAIPASDVAVAGSMNVTVTNPAPGGGTSSAFAIVVDGYTVGGSSTASVASGQPATLQITVTPTANGFSNPVAFSISGLPSGVSALFAPMSVTPGGKAVTTMLTITDGSGAASRAKSQAGISGGGIAPTLLLIGVMVLLAWLGFEARGRSIPEMRHYATVGLFVFMLIAGSVLGGCALGVTSSPSSQTSQLTVTATSGTMTQTFGITLTVTH